jgi:hypothetical protein
MDYICQGQHFEGRVVRFAGEILNVGILAPWSRKLVVLTIATTGIIIIIIVGTVGSVGVDEPLMGN